MSTPLRIASLEAFVFRCPAETPVRTSRSASCSSGGGVRARDGPGRGRRVGRALVQLPCVDVALWDLAARRLAEGHRAFKLKIGFGAERDLADLGALSATLGDDVALMADANQSWSLDAALEMARRLQGFGLVWLEEPLRADRPGSEWQVLARGSTIALAAGENVTGEAGFEAAIACGALRVVQPDLAKWGGFSGCVPVAKRVLAAGLRQPGPEGGVPMTNDLCALSATELLSGYRKKTISPVEATRAVLARIESLDPLLNAFCLVNEKSALASARESEARWRRGDPKGMLDGVPVSIKDLLLTRGWPTRRGSRTIDPKGPWRDDAPCVARLREHGAVLLGKTTTPEFGWKGVTDSPLTGVTRNPWDPKMTPGGSSGGAAAALAAAMGPLEVGTDGGGSIRIPCGFTGLVGLKPSFGRVPAWPLSPFGTVAHVGPMARSVADAALMLNVLALPDARDWFALPYEPRDYRVGLEDGVKGLRIAFSEDLGYAKVDPEIRAIVKKAVRTFADLGARVEAKDPGFPDQQGVFTRHWFAGAAALLEAIPPGRRKLVDPGLRDVARQGARIATLAYLDAVQKRGALGVLMNRFHETYDLLVTPTLPLAAFEAGKEVAHVLRQKRWTDWTPFTYPFNLTQQPAASIPCGFTRKGLPVGLQVVGPRYADALVLRAARAFESAHPVRVPELARLKR